MINIFNSNQEINYKFDLKGSKIGIKTLENNNYNSVEYSGKVLKDLEYLNMNINIPLGDKREIKLNQIQEAVEFLSANNSNDYSLLLGVYKDNDFANTKFPPKKTKSILFRRIQSLSSSKFSSWGNKKDSSYILEGQDNHLAKKNNLYLNLHDGREEDNGIKGINKRETYYFGIIDILTEFNCSKKGEYLFKLMRYYNKEISYFPPHMYGERFKKFIRENTFKESKNDETTIDKSEIKRFNTLETHKIINIFNTKNINFLQRQKTNDFYQIENSLSMKKYNTSYKNFLIQSDITN